MTSTIDESATGAVTAALLDAVAPIIGPGARFEQRPEALDTSYGPATFGFRLAGEDLPDGWDRPLVVRVPDGEAGSGSGSDTSLEAEAAALAFCGRNGIAAPDALALLAASDLGLAALVTSRPTGAGMLELIGAAPERTNTLLKALAEQQAALHACPLDDVGVPALALDERIAEVERGPADLAKETAWLRANVPAAATSVLCHGYLQPLVASGDPGVGEPLTIRNWARAVVAEPEYDLAMTVLAFWSAPFYAGTRSERAGLKMIRDMLANLYQGSYEAVRPLDAARLRYWQAYHAVRGMADPATPTDLVPALRKRFKKLASGGS